MPRKKYQVLYPGSKYQTLHPANGEKHLLKRKYQVLQPSTKYHNKYFIPRRGGVLGKEETPSVTPNWQVQDNKYQVLHLTMGEEYLPVTKDPLERWEPSPRITFMLTRISL